jgi:hypothetical protein
MRYPQSVYRSICAIALLVVSAACSSGETESPAVGSRVARRTVPPLPTMSAAALRAIPLTVAVDLPLQASVYAWRDFLPAADAPTGRQDLRVSVQVRGGVVAPKTLACAGAYLLHKDSVYVSAATEQRAGDGPGAVECLLRGGPQWPVNASMDVILRVQAGDSTVLIRRETVIDATS